MKTPRKPSPARSQGPVRTPIRHKHRSSRSVSSVRSNASGILSALVHQRNMNSVALSPLTGRKSILSDNTEIEEPRRKSWWKNLGESSRDVIEILEDNSIAEPNNIIEELDIEILSQEKKNYSMDLPESSGSESINSIVIPQRKLFTQKENLPQQQFGKIIGTRDTLDKFHKPSSGVDKTINVRTKELFKNKQRSNPIFPAALLNISPNKTAADKTKDNATVEPRSQVRNIFGKRAAKRKNMFTNFIASESEDEIPEIQPQVFGFCKNLEAKRRGSSSSRSIREPSPTSSFTTDIEMDDWKMLPSSTIVELNVSRSSIKTRRQSKNYSPNTNQIIEEPIYKSDNAKKKSKINSNSSEDKNKHNTSAAIVDQENDDDELNFSLRYDNENNEDDEIEEYQVINEPENNKSITKTRASKSMTPDQRANTSKPNKSLPNKVIGETAELQSTEEEKNHSIVTRNKSQEPTGQTNDASTNSDSKVDANEVDNVEVEQEYLNQSQDLKSMSQLVDKRNGVENDEESDLEQDEDDEVQQDEIEEQNESEIHDISENEEEQDQNFAQNQIRNEKSQDVEHSDIQEMEVENDKEAQNDMLEQLEKSEMKQTESQEHNESQEPIGEMEQNLSQEVEENKEEAQEQESQEEIGQENEEQNESAIQGIEEGYESDIQENESDVQDEEEESENDIQDNEEQMECDIHDNDEENDSDIQNVEEENENNIRENEDENESDIQDIEEENDIQDNDDQNESGIQDNEEQNESGIQDNEEQNESGIQDNEDQNETVIEDNARQNESDIQDIEEQNESGNQDNANQNNNEEQSEGEKEKNEAVAECASALLKSNVFPDGTRNSSAEGSGWDSHRTTRKTIRQTYGQEFSPRKSLRALVMERSAKRQTQHNEIASVTAPFPQANSTEMQESNRYDEHENHESNHESLRTRQTTLEMYLQEVKKKNAEERHKNEEEVRNSLNAPSKYHIFKVPAKPMFARRTKAAPKPKQNTKPTEIFGELPMEFIEDMKYKPPRRFQPRDAPWITQRLYKFLEAKLKPKYDYKARVRAEKLVENVYHFAKELRRRDSASVDAVEVLKREMARLDIVKTHFEFNEFIRQFMPREVRVKVIPDVVNKISFPKRNIYADIL